MLRNYLFHMLPTHVTHCAPYMHDLACMWGVQRLLSAKVFSGISSRESSCLVDSDLVLLSQNVTARHLCTGQ